MLKKSILLIDDEPLELEIFEHKARLKGREINLSQVADFTHAKQLALDKIDLIFLDYGCTEQNTLVSELADLRDAGFTGEIVIMSNLPPEQQALEGIAGEIFDNIDKRHIDQTYLQRVLARTSRDQGQ